MADCAVCGAAHAPFGVGVSLKGGKPGTWYCRDHRPAAAGPLKAPPPPPPPAQAKLL